ncbi:MAG: iron-sulfur cluster assembly accessory protein [Deltaproteobacteria bacterium]|nr:iron-sulfur cluster assembly accessory protein [Deltaproteobacteria bacterium]
MTESTLTVTDAAAEKIRSAKTSEGRDDVALRVMAREDGAKFRYELKLVSKDSKEADDSVIHLDGIDLYLDRESVPRLDRATLDFVDDISGSGLKFDNPNQTTLARNPLAVRVQAVLDDRVNPGLAAHGGVVSLVSIEETRVVLSFGGGCQGCGMADLTMKEGVSTQLKQQIPEISEVVDATDHAAGENPYYA